MVHITFLLVLLCMNPRLNRKYPFRFFSFVILFLFMSLRYDYGNDYRSYFSIHSLINSGSYAWGSEDILYLNLNLLLPNFFVFIAFTSLFYIISIWYLLKNSLSVKQYWFATFILLINPYLFLVQLSSLRQTLAICFFIFAVVFAIKRRLIAYIISVLFAIGMHSSGIILLPLYIFLTDKPFNKKKLFITLASLALLMFTPLFDLIVTEILKFLPGHYKIYYEQGLQNSLISTLISSLYFALVVFNLHKLQGKELVFGKLSLISTIISIVAMKLSMVTRIGMYFDIFLIVTIPHIFEKIQNKLYKKILFIILILIYILRYYSFFNDPLWESFRTYKTILGM